MHVSAVPVASISKHDIGGIIMVAIAAVLVIFGGLRLAAKVAQASLVLVLGLVAAVIAILLFTRVI